ncbi:MAG: SDR family NAD(P)-dependent oxidoreductase [Microbacteriaceae bacterium]
MDLSGRRILVTGGTGALGQRIAERLRSAGAMTVIAGAGQSDRLSAAMAHSPAFAVDLSRTGSGEALIDAVRAGGGLDGIVFAHGVVAFGSVSEMPSSISERVMAINLTSVIEITAAAIPLLQESAAAGGSPFVVTMSGVISESAMPGMGVYGASKAGVRHFVAAAARELRRDGIRVLDTRPPHTETGLAGRAVAGTAPQFPTGANPDDVAARIVSAIVHDEKDVASTDF